LWEEREEWRGICHKTTHSGGNTNDDDDDDDNDDDDNDDGHNVIDIYNILEI
jgi:hypothetical protein